jgi:N-acetylornithine carbamoyltransferase
LAGCFRFSNRNDFSNELNGDWVVKHFLSTNDWSVEDLASLLQVAGELKQNPINSSLKGRSIALLFLNPSMRTRTSFDLGMQQMGGIAIVLQPGKDAW